MTDRTKITWKPKGVNERHYTWSGGAFPKPDTSAAEFTNGVEVTHEGVRLVVKVKNHQTWRLIHQSVLLAISRAVGGTGILRAEKK